ncbi:16831_t:CDS:2, partial [Acaulospora morrowiae]
GRLDSFFTISPNIKTPSKRKNEEDKKVTASKKTKTSGNRGRPKK